MPPYLPLHRLRFHAIMVDNGVLRLNEGKQVHEMLNNDLGVNLTVVDASDLFLSRLDGIDDPEQKRKIIGNTFINVFEAEAAKIEAAAAAEEAQNGDAQGEEKKKGRVEWLLQGTLYPDVIESISFKGPSATIKTHHNVGGLLKDMKLKLIEPLRELFKGALRCPIRLLITSVLPSFRRFCFVRGFGETAKLICWHDRRSPRPRPPAQYPRSARTAAPLPWPRPRDPHPGPCDAGAGKHYTYLPRFTITKITYSRNVQVHILQQADAIYIEEIRRAALYDQIAQAFAVLLPVRAVGVMGDKRTYEQVLHRSCIIHCLLMVEKVIALRAVQSEDFMTADWCVLFGLSSIHISVCSQLCIFQQVRLPAGGPAPHLVAHYQRGRGGQSRNVRYFEQAACCESLVFIFIFVSFPHHFVCAPSIHLLSNPF